MGKSLYIFINFYAFKQQELKFWKIIYIIQPYLETTSSKQVEYTKAFEITIIKELGKMTPLRREKVCHSC